MRSPSTSTWRTSRSSTIGCVAGARSSGKAARSRESLDEALALLAGEGVPAEEVAAAARRVSVELVLTAHPTEALPRTILEKHRRIAGLLEQLDDARLTPSERAACERELAEEVTILWQTDEVRSERPRVVDEIRQALWFLEDSLWDAAADAACGVERAASGLAAPLRYVDRRRYGRQSERRRGDRSRGRRARRGTRPPAPPPRRPRARGLGGCRARSSRRTRPSQPSRFRRRNPAEPYRRRLTAIWERLGSDGYGSQASSATSST